MIRPYQLFYHCACMGHWKEIVQEHAELFKRIELSPMVVALGNQADIDYLRTFWNVIFADAHIRRFETPTLLRLWRWCQKHPSGAVIYAHTKGASKPNFQTDHRHAWRRWMNYWVIEKWHENLVSLDNYDVVGADWTEYKGYKCFPGNFFAARADWINKLDNPWIHRGSRDGILGGNSWKRIHAEMWLGSRDDCRVKSLCCSGVHIHKRKGILQLR